MKVAWRRIAVHKQAKLRLSARHAAGNRKTRSNCSTNNGFNSLTLGTIPATVCATALQHKISFAVWHFHPMFQSLTPGGPDMGITRSLNVVMIGAAFAFVAMMLFI
ncbi:hypothetical protein ACLE20_12660 [Rhizobium sp. YIM 134829]|uniref:hypothetical protein n=1 Tax=Rhizobium sp. YIM 134829 TaxID=3390453 RepID=UPI00397BB957